MNILEQNERKLQEIISDLNSLISQLSGYPAIPTELDAILSSVGNKECTLERYFESLDRLKTYLREWLEVLLFDAETAKDYPFIIDGHDGMEI